MLQSFEHLNIPYYYCYPLYKTHPYVQICNYTPRPQTFVQYNEVDATLKIIVCFLNAKTCSIRLTKRQPINA